jgi:hypothetical protein
MLPPGVDKFFHEFNQSIGALMERCMHEVLGGISEDPPEDEAERERQMKGTLLKLAGMYAILTSCTKRLEHAMTKMGIKHLDKLAEMSGAIAVSEMDREHEQLVQQRAALKHLRKERKCCTPKE